MFDIGFPELFLLCIIALLVLGPERMPEAVRTLGLWIGRLRRNFTRLKQEIEREVGMDEVRRQLHNESVLEEIRRLERDIQGKRTNEPAPDVPHDAAPPQPDGVDAGRLPDQRNESGSTEPSATARRDER
jgi:sec-independent protein translocase protein TatB